MVTLGYRAKSLNRNISRTKTSGIYTKSPIKISSQADSTKHTRKSFTVREGQRQNKQEDQSPQKDAIIHQTKKEHRVSYA